jgi:hypothetical protein
VPAAAFKHVATVGTPANGTPAVSGNVNVPVNGIVAIKSVTVTPPANGVIVVIGTGWCNMTQAAGIGLELSTGSLPVDAMNPGTVFVSSANVEQTTAATPVVAAYRSFGLSRSFPVTIGVPITVSLNAQRFHGGVNPGNCGASLTAFFTATPLP